MRRRCGSPCGGPAVKRPVLLVSPPPENRRAFRHESGAPQRIRVAIVCPTSISLPRQHVLSVIIGLRDNQTASQGSSLGIAGGSVHSECFRNWQRRSSSIGERFTRELVIGNAGLSNPPKATPHLFLFSGPEGQQNRFVA